MKNKVLILILVLLFFSSISNTSFAQEKTIETQKNIINIEELNYINNDIAIFKDNKFIIKEKLSTYKYIAFINEKSTLLTLIKNPYYIEKPT